MKDEQTTKIKANEAQALSSPHSKTTPNEQKKEKTEEYVVKKDTTKKEVLCKHRHRHTCIRVRKRPCCTNSSDSSIVIKKAAHRGK